jgi:hypothetical protein
MTTDSGNGAHTPGPWIEHGELTTGSMQGYIAIGPAKVGRVIVVVHRRDVALVKAAPDMLMALKEFVENQPAITRGDIDRLAKAKAVIAKAEGRT